LSHKKWCPRCDQGWVVPVRVIKNGIIIQFCLECDAIWPNEFTELHAERYSPNFEPDTFWSLAPFLDSQGIHEEIGSIENVWPDNEHLWRA
jgi:hypothetical protein